VNSKIFTLSKAGLLSLCVSASLAQAQDDDAVLEEVYITGYRGALLNATEAKRDSVGFSDEVFSDDMGKMPSQNLAESLSRIPGVKINREVTGEGQQISVRGLGAEFTKVVLNGNSMAVASTGDMNANNNGRQVDLNMFPTELFKSLSVNKTATAGQIEGGVSGYVDMRTARASDFGDGHSVRFSLESKYKDTTEEFSPKAVLSYSFSDEKFGVLATVVAQNNAHGIDGYETTGNVAQQTCLIAEDGNGCRDESGAGIRHGDVATADYVAANPGVAIGSVIDVNQVSGLSDQEIAGMGLPYIGRLATTSGEKDSVSALLSFEYLPNEDMSFALDIISADAKNDYVRDELMHIYRRNYIHAPVLSNIQLDDKNRIESGTFYGSAPWVGSRDYNEDLSFVSVMPSFEWHINDILKMDASLSKTDSELVRDNPYGLVFTAPGTLTINDDDVVPTVNHSALDDYSAYSVNDDEDKFRYGHTERETDTMGIHVDFELGEDAEANGFRFGFSSEEINANRETFEPSFDIALDTDGDDSVSMNEYLAANGLPDMVANMGDYIRTVDFGSNIDGWNGLTSFGATDWSAVKGAINYNSIETELLTRTVIEEKVTAYYLEANTTTEVAGRELKTNSGIRMVNTDQYVATMSGETKEDYKRILPSFSAVYDVVNNVKVRASASRSLTRANPADMFPNSEWDGSGIDKIKAGNPTLSPFESTNFDIGGEWYFSDMGYVGLTYYTKDITGFTIADTLQDNLNNLGNWGIELDNLLPTQVAQAAICNPNCMVSVETKVNTRGVSTLTGYELVWVQPLDFVLEGLGFNASANSITDESPEGAEITGISDSYNVTAYYENEGFQTRLTYYNQEGAYAFNSWGQDVTGRDRAQVDFSASYDLPVLEDYGLTLTFDAYNITNEAISSTIDNDERQTFNAYFPGATYTFGIRGSF